MDGGLDRASAETYATWFRALADPTRVQLVTLLARRGAPMSVGEIVAASGVGQSTVSHHLRVLAGVRFVLADQEGTTRWYRVNDACVSCFPSAADVVMGKAALPPPACGTAPEARGRTTPMDCSVRAGQQIAPHTLAGPGPARA